ncbi:MAG: hypothetical protein QXI32_02225 [Candidatus Bathyarchaeia archaeon]
MPEYFHLTPEREKEMIEQIARYIAKSEIRDFLKIVLKTYGMSNVFGNLGFIYSYTYARGLLGDFGGEITELLALNPVHSSQLILQRVEELEEEERLHPENALHKRSEEKVEDSSILKRIFYFFKG